MNSDPGSLSNLRDIATPEPVPWWPPAPGWYLLLAVLAVGVVFSSMRAWKKWRANAYRREALDLLQAPASAPEIAAILKRTALAAFPRAEVASLTGAAWCDWLEQHGPEPIAPAARSSLAQSVFGRAEDEADAEAMRHFAVAWIKHHRADVGRSGESETKPGKALPC